MISWRVLKLHDEKQRTLEMDDVLMKPSNDEYRYGLGWVADRIDFARQFLKYPISVHVHQLDHRNVMEAVETARMEWPPLSRHADGEETQEDVKNG